MSDVDLESYFQRIGYSGPRAPTLATLNALVSRHIRSIPFENLDVLLGRPIRLDTASLQRKLILERRGGYCFEQNGLLLAVLEALGYDAAPISARARLQRTRDFTPPRTHLFVRVEIEGQSWLADVGVGALSPTAALRLEEDIEQPTLHETRRIVREGPLLFHQARLGQEWADICEFTLEQMPPVDREVANWFTSTHPESHFRNRLLVARAGDNGTRVTLLNNELTVRDARTGESAVRLIESPQALLAVLEAEFGLTFPEGTRFPLSG